MFLGRVSVAVASIGMVVLGLPFVFGVPSALEAAEESAVRPNIVLIAADDHGYRYASFMGHSMVKTPNLDRLAEGGTLFRTAYNTASVCEPALRTLLDGSEPYPRREGWRQFPRFFPLVARSLPTQLKRAGYRSFQAGKFWPRTYALGGFDGGTKGPDAIGKSFERAMGGREGLKVGRTTMAPIDAFLDEVGEQPFFLWFAPLIPHGPWDPPQKYLDMYADAPIGRDAREYFASVSWLDEVVGELVEDLRRRGLLDNTLIVYLSDNGHGPFPFEGDVTGSSRRSKSTLFELGMRTPLIFHWPGHVPAGVVREDLVSTLDLLPTLLGFAGLEPSFALSGLNLREEIEGETSVSRTALIGRVRGRVRGFEPKGLEGRNWGEPKLGYYVRTKRWHYIWYDDPGFDLLFDLAADPTEQVDVSGKHPELIAGFRRDIGEWREQGEYVAPVAAASAEARPAIPEPVSSPSSPSPVTSGDLRVLPQ